MCRDIYVYHIKNTGVMGDQWIKLVRIFNFSAEIIRKGGPAIRVLVPSSKPTPSPPPLLPSQLLLPLYQKCAAMPA